MYNASVYCGKESADAAPTTDLGGKVVRQLILPLQCEGRNINTDNYFTSLQGRNHGFKVGGVQHVADAEVYFREYPPMTSAKTRVFLGVWGLCLLWGPGTTPFVGGQGASPPEADDISA